MIFKNKQIYPFMKLRNGKTYKYFHWESILLLSQLKASNSKIQPICVNNEIIWDGISGNTYLIVKKSYSKNNIIQKGIQKGFLKYDGKKITNNVFLCSQSFAKNKIFINEITKELKKNLIGCDAISYID